MAGATMGATMGDPVADTLSQFIDSVGTLTLSTPNPPQGTNSTQVATTHYVIVQIYAQSPSIYTFCGGL